MKTRHAELHHTRRVMCGSALSCRALLSQLPERAKKVGRIEACSLILRVLPNRSYASSCQQSRLRWMLYLSRKAARGGARRVEGSAQVELSVGEFAETVLQSFQQGQLHCQLGGVCGPWPAQTHKKAHRVFSWLPLLLSLLFRLVRCSLGGNKTLQCSTIGAAMTKFCSVFTY